MKEMMQAVSACCVVSSSDWILLMKSSLLLQVTATPRISFRNCRDQSEVSITITVHHPPITAHLRLAVVRGGGPRPLLAAAATLLARTRDLQVALLLQQYNLYTNQIICFPVFLAIKWQNQVRYCIKNMTFLMTMTIVVQDLILKQLHKNIAFLLFSRGVGFCLAAVCACKYF